MALYSCERAALVILKGGGSFCSGCFVGGVSIRRLVCCRDPMKRVFSLMLFRRCGGGDGQVEAVVLCVALTEQSSPRFESPWFVLRPDRTEMERGGGRASLGARVF
ncbi:hypothetical protein Rs2_16140 [Raphanus sativus]|nr:hypothetical protein Rs2_16140 [Raphanus sativus]